MITEFTIMGRDYTVPVGGDGKIPKKSRLKAIDFPVEYRMMKAPGCRVAADILLNATTLAHHKRYVYDDVDEDGFFRSFAAIEGMENVPNDVRTATLGMLIDKYTEERY